MPDTPFGEGLGRQERVEAKNLHVEGPEQRLQDDRCEIFETCDVVYVLAAPTPGNQGLVSADLMQRLQPSQTLIVISRSHLVDFDALTTLVVGRRFRLGMDVFPTEPLPGDHPLRDAEAAVLSGHRAGAVSDALLSIGDMVVNDLDAIITGRGERRLQYLTPDRLPALLQPSP